MGDPLKHEVRLNLGGTIGKDSIRIDASDPQVARALSRWDQTYPQFETWIVKKVVEAGKFDLRRPGSKATMRSVKNISLEPGDLPVGASVIVGFYDSDRHRPYILCPGGGVSVDGVIAWPTFRQSYCRWSLYEAELEFSGLWEFDSDFPTSVRFSEAQVRWDRLGASGLYSVSAPWLLRRDSTPMGEESDTLWYDLSLIAESAVALSASGSGDEWVDAPDYPLIPLSDSARLEWYGDDGVVLWVSQIPELDDDGGGDDGGGDDGGIGVG